jgi:ribosomal protein S18 acetylase RimI-like enzyme
MSTVQSRGGGWIAWWIVWISISCSPPYALVLAFQSTITLATSEGYGTATPRLSTRAPLVPLTEFQCMSDFLRTCEEDSVREPCTDSRGHVYPSRAEVESSDEPYVLGVVEPNDLLDVSKFIVRCFGADAMLLSPNLSPIERAVVSPAVELLNEFSQALAVAELYQGLRIRTHGNRNRAHLLDPPANDDHEASDAESQDKLASRFSVVIALARMKGKHESLLDIQVQVVAAVKVCLEPCDAKIPFALPILDSFERTVGSLFGASLGENESVTLQPYLSNLCVDERLRGQGVGRVLIQAVAHVARYWGYSSLYLHVDEENAAAYRLYISEGYRDVGRRWKPFWAGRAATLSYLMKDI